jgi:thiamine-monophosphate kinase
VRLDRIGEFGLIDRLRETVRMRSRQVVLGIGDDAAVLRNSADSDLLLTTDTLVEGVHFNLRYTPLESLGWKALAVNLSDIAAMGGIPIAAVISIAVPEHWCVEDVDQLYRGITRCAKEYRCPVVGGDTTRSSGGCFLSIAVAGRTARNKAMYRSGARPGDMLCMTGEMGGARTGFEILRAGADAGRFKKSVRRFLRPIPMLEASSRLLRHLPISSMIDVSDGLASEIKHICEQSGVGCLIDEERIPVSGEAMQWAEEKRNPLSAYVFESGEEYELLFTISPKTLKNRLSFTLLARSIPVRIIGEITKPSKGIRVCRKGKIGPLLFGGWNHFVKKVA